MRRFRPVLLCSAAALAAPGSALAHANFVRSDPADGSVLPTAPSRVEVVFDDAVRVGPGIEAVRNGGGSILAGKPFTRGRVLTIPLSASLPNGDYSVRWSVVSDDGHVIQGVVAFAVGAGRAPPVATLTASSALGADVLVSRWLFFLGVLGAGGLALFELVVGRGTGSRPGLLAGALVLAFLGSEGLVHASHAGSATRFGVVLTTAAVVSAVGAAAAAIATVDPRLRHPAEAVALVLLMAPTLSGHALDPGRSWVDVPIDLLHVVAGAFWFGGIAALATSRDGLALARRFSPLALGAVIAIAVTGGGRALAELASVSQLWSTGYGRAIAIKSILLLALVVAAYLSRSALAGAWTRVRASVRGELVLLLGVVGAVGVLTALPPGNRHVRAVAAPPRAASTQPPLPPENALVLGKQSGPLAVTLAVEGEANGIRASAVFIGTQGEGVTIPNVRVAGKDGEACGPGCYAATLPALPRTLVVERPGGRITFDLPEKFEPAGDLVARATRAFHAQRAVTYTESLSSGLGTTVVSRWQLQRPNKFTYAIRGGAQAVVIGARRWDRTQPNGKWIRSPQLPVTQPVPLWWQGRNTNAYILDSTPNTVTVSFLDRDGPAWFTVVLDRSALLPQRVVMTATAHFMHQRYAPARSVSIVPPA